MTTPMIEGVDASQYLRDVEDNGSVLIVCGDHPDVCNDAILTGKTVISDFMDINKAALRWGGLSPASYCATLHSADIGSDAFPTSTIHPSTLVVGLRVGCEAPRVDMTIHATPVGGTSALFACIAGLVLGYKTIHLCGVRLEPGTIYYDEHVRKNWAVWLPVLGKHLHVVAPEDNWLKEMYNG